MHHYKTKYKNKKQKLTKQHENKTHIAPNHNTSPSSLPSSTLLYLILTIPLPPLLNVSISRVLKFNVEYNFKIYIDIIYPKVNAHVSSIGLEVLDYVIRYTNPKQQGLPLKCSHEGLKTFSITRRIACALAATQLLNIFSSLDIYIYMLLLIIVKQDIYTYSMMERPCSFFDILGYLMTQKHWQYDY